MMGDMCVCGAAACVTQRIVQTSEAGDEDSGILHGRVRSGVINLCEECAQNAFSLLIRDRDTEDTEETLMLVAVSSITRIKEWSGDWAHFKINFETIQNKDH